MPKVSVIIPVYGVEKYIERCARSLFEQTLNDIEYLFIDDCTPDRSIDILKQVLEEYPQRKPQVTIHRMEHNSGQAKVRETGIKMARGEYLIHCDSDDWVEPDAYESLYKEAKENDYDMLFCDYYKDTDGNTEYISNKIMPAEKNKNIENFLLNRVKASLWLVLTKRDLYKVNSFRLPTKDMTEDTTTIVQLAYLSQNTGYLHNAYYHYRINPDSISQEMSETKCLKRFHDAIGNNKLLEQFFMDLHCGDLLLLTKIRRFNCRWVLLPLIDKFKYYKIFTFAEGGYITYLLSKHIPFFEKIKLFVTILGLYPIFTKRQ